MTEPSAQADRIAQMNAIYKALGKFLVEFSGLISRMEAGLYFAIGGGQRDQQLIRAIVIELTADPLARAWRSVMTQATDDLSSSDLDVLSKLAAEISSLINLRNDWAHGIWFVGYGNEPTTDWSTAALMRFKNSAKGVAAPSSLESLPTAEYIEKVAAHAAFVADAVFTFGMIVSGRRTGGFPNVHPSDRIHITKVGGRRQLEVTPNGDDWRSSEMP
jgi:hypothetical protein